MKWNGHNLKKRGGATTKWITIIANDPCAYCGDKGGSVDHVVPQSLSKITLQGFSIHHWTNLVGVCQKCNSMKDAKTIVGFLAAKGGLR